MCHRLQYYMVLAKSMYNTYLNIYCKSFRNIKIKQEQQYV